MIKAGSIDIKSEIIKLAKRYAQIAMEHDCRTGKQLSQTTFKLREAGENIPYLAVGTTNTNWYPAPKKNQKLWAFWLDPDNDFLKKVSTEEGWYNMYVNAVDGGFEIEAYNSKHKEDRTVIRTVLVKYTFQFDTTTIKKHETTNG